MTRRPESAARRQRTPLVRMLAVALLFLVVYVSTVEVVHRHGNAPPANSAATSIGSTDETDSTAKKLIADGECLICQLHRHLYSGLLRAPMRVPAPSVRHTTVPAVAAFYHSAPSAPRRGRAPPLPSPI